MQLFKRYTHDDHQARGKLWRMATLIWGGQNGLKLEGDFVECGCYNGITAKIIYNYFDLSSKGGKKYYLYDLFEYEGYLLIIQCQLIPNHYMKQLKICLKMIKML